MSGAATDFELAELQQYYHLPLREAAKRLGSCEAVIKRVCRRKNIQRWPYRQVSSKLIKIQHLCKYMAHVTDPEQVARIQQKIRQLTHEYLELVGGQVPSELQLSAADIGSVPPPSYSPSGELEAEVLAAANEEEADDASSSSAADDVIGDDDNDEEMSQQQDDDDTVKLSAYSLRFILADCTVLETYTGVQFSTAA